MNPNELPATPVPPFHTHEETGVLIHFRKPTVSELDRFTSKVAKAPVSASLVFCDALVLETSKVNWTTLIEQLPGAGSTVAGAITEKMGFRQA
jgi:hypothetical protein